MRGGVYGYLLLVTIYAAYACALFPIAWGDWWLDYRLTVPTFLLDRGGVPHRAVSAPKASRRASFVSAYFAFFAFLRPVGRATMELAHYPRRRLGARHCCYMAVGP